MEENRRAKERNRKEMEKQGREMSGYGKGNCNEKEKISREWISVGEGEHRLE